MTFTTTNHSRRTCSTRTATSCRSREHALPYLKDGARKLTARRALLLWTLLLAAAAAVCVDWRSGALRLQLDSRPAALLDADSPDVRFLHATEARFQLDPQLLLGIPADALGADPAEKLASLHKALQALPGVARVESLVSAPLLTATATGVDARTLAERLRQAGPGPAPLAALLEKARHDPFLSGALVSPDGRWLGFALTLAELRPADDAAWPERIRAALSGQLRADQLRITGAPLMEAASGQLLASELRSLLPRLVLVIAVLILALTRRPLLLLLALAVALSVLLWTGAVIALSERPLNLVTALLPALLVSISVGYAMLALTEGGAGFGLALAATASAFGFLVLAVTPVPAVQQFGIFAALGAGFLWGACVLAAAVWRSAGSPVTAGEGLKRRAVIVLSRLQRRRRTLVLVSSALLAAASVPGVLRVTSGSDLAGGLPEDSPVRQDYETLNRDFGGINRLFIVVDGHTPDSILQPSALEAIGGLQTWLRAQPELGGSLSVVDLLGRLQQAYSDPGDTAPALDAAGAKQLLWLGGAGAGRNFADQEFARACIVLRSAAHDTATLARMLPRLQAQLAQLPAPLTGQVTGASVVLAQTVDAIAGGQAQGLLIAFAVILATLTFLFTSPTVALVALLPTVLPVLVYFAALGYLGLPLTPATSLIACIVIGLAVDNTIHHFVRFNEFARATGRERRATRLTLAAMLRPSTVTAVILCLAFLTLATGRIPDQAQFGALAAFTLAVAWLVDLTLTPALAAGLRIVTVWDLMLLDLGKAPQHGIPLFRDLSARQSRVFVLMSDLRSLQAGRKLLEEGESGSDFFLVLEGELSATVVRDGAVRELGRAGRGALIGEAGFLGQPRTATVTALTACRLLRADALSLERLRRRYPGIAALVFRNLHRSLAQRFAHNVQLIR